MDPDLQAQKIAQTMNATETTAEGWGLEYVDGGVGWAKARLAIQGNMLNGFGMAHGGVIFSLADTVFAYACNSRNQRAVAQHASITFIAPAYEGDVLIAEAREEEQQGRSGVYSVKVSREDGETIAIFNGLSRTIKGGILED